MSLPQPPAPQITTCYRHPNREAGRRCTRCGRPACDECLVRADIGSQCLECARAGRPDTRTRARYWSARQPTLVTYAIMAINVAVFIWIAAADPDSLTRDVVTREQADLGLNKYVVAVNDDWYRLVTSGFLHFGVLHIALNMFLLFQLGNLLEPLVGRVKFALLYFAGLLGGSAGVMLLSDNPRSIDGGASGAVFGLLGAATVLLLHRGINPLRTSIGAVLIMNLLFTFAIPNISIGGHLGGVVAGAAAGWFVVAPKGPSMPSWAGYAAPVGIMVISLAVSYFAAEAVDISPFIPR